MESLAVAVLAVVVTCQREGKGGLRMQAVEQRMGHLLGGSGSQKLTSNTRIVMPVEQRETLGGGRGGHSIDSMITPEIFEFGSNT